MRRLVLIGASAAGAVLALLLLASGADASPAAPVTRSLSQPDGSTFAAQPYGDEYVNGFETTAGYTVVQDDAGTWSFAGQDAEGRLVPTGARPGPTGQPPSDLALEPHLRDEVALDDARTEQEGLDTEEPPPPATGTQHVLALLVQFSDQALTTTAADWSSLFFGPSDSLSSYYDTASFGALDLQPVAETQGTVDDGVVIVTLPTPHPDAGNDYAAFQASARAALHAADASVDFAAYDTDANGTLSADELHLGIVAAGSEAALGCPGPSVWGHRTSLDDPPIADGVALGGFESRGGIFAGGEPRCDPVDQATVGIWVHEFGHDLGLIDLYDADGSSGGVSRWSVMGDHWLSLPGEPIGTRPPMPDPFSRWQLGWLTPNQVTSTTADLPLNSSASNNEVTQVLDNPNGVDVGFLGGSGEGEYFLVENRVQEGLDVALEGCGALVWHIDESQATNADDDSRRVDVEEANGGRHQSGYADAEDPYPSVDPVNDSFGPGTSPDSSLNSGLPSGVSLTDFTPDCGPTLTVDVEPGGGPVPRPANDRLSEARVIRLPLGVASAQRVVRGHNVGATAQPGEPVHGRAEGRASAWFVVRAPKAGYLNITSQSTFREAIAVYTGPNITHLTRVDAVRGTPPDTGGAGAPTENVYRGLGFRVERNVRYLIAVDSIEAGDEGGIRLTVDFDAARPDARPVRQVVDPGRRPEIAFQVRNSSDFEVLRVSGWSEGARLLDPTDCPDTLLLQPGEARTCHARVPVNGQAGERLAGKVWAWIEWPDLERFSFVADPWFARVRG